jgi:hypothetical protein
VHSLPDAPPTREEAETQLDAEIGHGPADALRTSPGRLAAVAATIRFPVAVYLATRVLYLLIALVDKAWHHTPLSAQVSNWDGAWYLAVAALGYPTHALHVQTTLGFLPLYPLTIVLVAHVLSSSYVFAGLLISMTGGLVATVLVDRLASAWWDAQAARRAVLFFCLFPGSIVFSMLYSEGLAIPLVAGCLLALHHRRWLLAGCLAGLATAVGPTSLAIVPACAVAAALELRRRGWAARRSLLAPALAPLGAVAFATFLWFQTGTPFASYIAQRHGWHQQTTPLAIPHIASHLGWEISKVSNLHHPGVNLNYVAGVVGAVFLLWALVLIARVQPRISPAAITWTACLSFLILTSSEVPPNPRMLITAFPALMVVAYRLRGKRFEWLIGISTALLVAMSLATYVGYGLRP